MDKVEFSAMYQLEATKGTHYVSITAITFSSSQENFFFIFSNMTQFDAK